MQLQGAHQQQAEPARFGGFGGDVIRPEGLRVLGLQLLDPAAVTGERGERDVSQNTPGEVVQMSWAVVKLVW